MTARGVVLAALVALPGAAEETAEAIMARVAENQQRSVEMRRAFLYRQNVLVRMKRGNGRLAREEVRDLTITPTATGFQKTLDRFEGKYEKDGRYIEYSKPGYTYKKNDIDGGIATDLADELTDEKASRDGISNSLFPLTPERQRLYTFKLEGREQYAGHDVFRLTFQPNSDETVWAGEALVEAREYQPVLVTTRMALRIPLVVRTLLGTDLRYLGFKVAYEKFADGVWFPVRYGGEFDLRAVFFYKRRIAISAINSGFRKTQVESSVSYGTAEAAPTR